MVLLLSDMFCGIYAILQADEDEFTKKNQFELTRKVFLLHREKELILFFIHESGEEMMGILREDGCGGLWLLQHKFK